MTIHIIAFLAWLLQIQIYWSVVHRFLGSSMSGVSKSNILSSCIDALVLELRVQFAGFDT